VLSLFWKAKRAERGFTLIELVVVLAILGILIALAVPRYLGARRNALVAEGDNVLQELKTLSWAYYQQYSTWVGVTAANMATTFGFTAPGGAGAGQGGCWSYDLAAAGAAAQIQLRANDEPAGSPGTAPRCGPLPGGAVVILTMNGDGSSTRSTSGL
jgi:prepilin-type N-terminal cleavage/methylation domain-containing protein